MGAIVVVALAVGIASAAADTDSAPYPDEPFVAAKSSRAFGDSIGVTVRFTWNSTAYGNWNAVESRMRELGVRFVTDGFCRTCPYQIERMKRLAAMGIKANIGPTGMNDGSAAMDQALKVIREQLLGSVVSVAGPNEPDISGDADWVAHARTYQQQLWSKVKGDPALRHLTVLGPPLVYEASRAQLGDLTPYLDRGNIHPYPGGIIPMSHIWREREWALPVSGTKPLVATETGYHNNLAYLGAHRGVSEEAAGAYIPRTVLEGFVQGVERTYIYQLIDPFNAEQAAQRGSSAWQNDFGLLRNDFSRKPAFTALRNLLNDVDADSAPVADPGGLKLGVEGAGADVRQMLLRSADGSYSLVLWRQVSVWDRAALKPLTPAPDTVDVVFGQKLATAQRFDPVDADGETARWSTPRRISVALAGKPVVLRLTPADAPTAPPSKGKGGEKGSGSNTKKARVRHREHLRKRIAVKVPCFRRCASVSAKGRLFVAGSKRSVKLGHSRRRAHKKVVVLHLNVPERALRRAHKAMGRGKAVRARLRITVRAKKGAKLRSYRQTIVFG